MNGTNNKRTKLAFLPFKRRQMQKIIYVEKVERKKIEKAKATTNHVNKKVEAVARK